VAHKEWGILHSLKEVKETRILNDKISQQSIEERNWSLVAKVFS
jgi:hypothetical protein